MTVNSDQNIKGNKGNTSASFLVATTFKSWIISYLKKRL